MCHISHNNLNNPVEKNYYMYVRNIRLHFQIKPVSLLVVILFEGTFSRVVTLFIMWCRLNVMIIIKMIIKIRIIITIMMIEMIFI